MTQQSNNPTIQQSSNKSFTILEVMLAISVLTMVVAGSFALIQQTLISDSLNRSKLTAYYFAQEGIEMVRNIRDDNWLNYNSWEEGIAEGLAIDSPQNYIADFQDTSLEDFEDKPLNLDGNGFYSYLSGESTPFKRKISITKTDIPDTLDAEDYALKVLVQVEWRERSKTHTIEVMDYLYNWYGY